MPRYVDPTEQLVTEILVADIKRSVRFYRELEFTLLRDGGDFVEEKKGVGSLSLDSLTRRGARSGCVREARSR